MEINIPAVVSEVRNAFDRYEQALTDNNIAMLKELFWDSPSTLRYGEAENLYGADQIHAFRAARPSGPRPRDLIAVYITTCGQDFAVTNAEFRNLSESRLGRQSQTWARIDGSWRIVAPHVSYMKA